MHIAICDDEEHVCYQLECMLTNVLKSKNIEYQIELFGSGESFCRVLKDKDFDMVFLDIELLEISGLDVGKYIRDVLENDTIQIAYISAKESYAIELFDYTPINFLVKPLNEKKVTKVIDKYLKITKQNNHMFEYKKRMEFYKIPISDIMYFESKNRKVTIYMRGKEDEFYESLEKVYAKVKNDDFLFIHQSIIVNYRFLKKISHEEVVMMNDVVLPISRSRRKEITAMHMKIRKREK